MFWILPCQFLLTLPTVRKASKIQRNQYTLYSHTECVMACITMCNYCCHFMCKENDLASRIQQTANSLSNGGLIFYYHVYSKQRSQKLEVFFSTPRWCFPLLIFKEPMADMIESEVVLIIIGEFSFSFVHVPHPIANCSNVLTANTRL